MAPLETSRATPVAHLHGGRAQHVVAVPRPGGAHGVGDQGEAPRCRCGDPAQHLRVQVDAVGDEPRRRPSGRRVSASTGPGSRWCTGRIALNRCVPTVTPASIASREVSKRASVWPRAAIDATPGEQGDGVEPVVELGREGHHAHGAVAGIQQSLHLGEVGRAQQGRVVGAAVRGAEPRPFEVDAGQLARADQRGQRPDRATRRSSVSVTRLATSEVVPWARCVAMTVAASAGSPVVKAAPPPPWQCWSTKPGTRVPREVPVGRRRRGAPAGAGHPVAAGLHPAGLDEPGREGDAVGGEDHASQPFFAGSWSLRSITSDSSPSSSRPGVRRFHLRMTNRNRK